MAKVMVVDDAESIRKQLRADLEGAGYLVIEAVDGLDALEKATADQEIKLILCDVNMPRMDGLTFCEKVFELEHYKKVPKFMLTTEANAEMKQRAKNAGVTAWIIKPYNLEKLLAAMSKVLAPKN